MCASLSDNNSAPARPGTQIAAYDAKIEELLPFRPRTATLGQHQGGSWTAQIMLIPVSLALARFRPPPRGGLGRVQPSNRREWGRRATAAPANAGSANRPRGWLPAKPADVVCQPISRPRARNVAKKARHRCPSPGIGHRVLPLPRHLCPGPD